jgi:hypothetical protein
MRSGSIRGFATVQAIPSASAHAECFAAGGLEILQSLEDHLDRPIPPRDPLPSGGRLATETLLDRSRGTLPTMVSGATSRVTTAPAASTAPFPTRTPGSTITAWPIQASCPMTTRSTRRRPKKVRSRRIVSE